MRNLVSYTLVAISAIFGALGIITLATWHSTLTPSTYTNALEESGVYSNMAKTIETYATTKVFNLNSILTDEIISSVNESVAGTEYEKYIDNPFVNSIIHQITNKIAIKLTDSIAQSFDLEKNIEKLGNKMITEHITWLRNSNYERPIELALVPPKDEIKNMSNEDVIKLIGTYITVSKYDLNKLSKCQSDAEEEKNLEYISEGEFTSLTCTSVEIQNSLISAIESENTNSDTNQGKIVTAIHDYIYAFMDQSKLAQILTMIKNVLYVVSYIKYVAHAERITVETVKYGSIILLGLSLITSTIAYFIKKTRSILTWVHTYTIVAMLTILYALFQISIVSTIIGKLLPTSYPNLSISDIPVANISMLAISIRNFVLMVHKTINMFVLKTGFTILIVMIMIYVGKFVYFRYKLKEKTKKYYKLWKKKANSVVSTK